jgi:PAS domain S-box-containing protein
MIAPQPVARITRTWGHAMRTPAAEQVVGYRRAEVPGKTIMETIIPVGERERVRRRLTGSTGSPSTGQARAPRELLHQRQSSGRSAPHRH